MDRKQNRRLQLTRATIDGLVTRGYLHENERYNQVAIEAALERFFAATFGTDPGESRPQGRPPGRPTPPRPQGSKPKPRVTLSTEAQQHYNDLVAERTIIVFTKHGLLSPETALAIFDDIAKEAKRRDLPTGALEAARFAKEALIFELKAEGLL
jgi:hypothetical protein